MTQLSATIARLSALRAKVPTASGAGATSRLADFPIADSNPGALKARIYVPVRTTENPSLVVVLHGCTQTAGGYDRGSGWSQLADEHGFILLFPEQQRANNPNLCFNWFSPADNARDRGEALSIRQMVAATTEAYAVDPTRIFVTGLSAGGAMTSVLLSAYPELFAGGAIIAGLPFGSAASVPQALEAMRGPGAFNPTELGDRVRRASNHAGPWPHVSIWHGTADSTVNSGNADAILAQWLSVHGLADQPDSSETIAGHRHRIWTDRAGRTVIEDYRIANMGHGTPLATMGEDACGMAMPHMLEAGISSTRRIAASWGLLSDGSLRTAAHSTVQPSGKTPAPAVTKNDADEPSPHDDRPSSTVSTGRVEKMIESALRAAGLMR